MSTRVVRKASDKSISSVTGCPEMEYFWASELTNEKPVATWSVKDDDLDDDDDDDFINHTLFVRTAALGVGTVPGEENVVSLESVDENGEQVRGVIINLSKGGQSMANLSVTIDGKVGGKFTLIQGSGPVCISGNHLLDYPKDDPLDNSQTASEISDDDEELGEEEEEDEIDEKEEEDEEEEEEMEKVKGKFVKRKGTPKANKQKKAKLEAKEEIDEEEDIDYDEEEDEEKVDSDEEKSKKKKRQAPVKDSSKSSDKGKSKTAVAIKDTSKKVGKKAKK